MNRTEQSTAFRMVRNLAILTLLFSLWCAVTVHAQTANQKKRICGLTEAKTKDQAFAKITLQTNLSVAFSGNHLNPDDSVNLQTDCLPLDTLIRLLIDSSLEVQWYTDKIVIYKPQEDNEAEPIQLFGYVKDAESKESLIAATIYLPQQKRGTATNSFGFFSMSNVMPGEPVLISFVGYQPLIYEPKESETEVLLLMTPAIELETVEVLSERQQQIDQLANPDKLSINSAPFNSAPYPGGEPDILKAIQQEVGVLSNEVGTGPVVRGGGPDQNLVLLDDVPFYDYNHMLGFTSIFNADIINKVYFHKGSFPAKHGGRLSSVIDVRTKDGNRHAWRTNLSLGLFSQKIALDGPIDPKGRFSLIASGRISTITPLIRILPIEQIKGFKPNFTDGHLKISFSATAKDRFNLLFFNSYDRLLDESESSERISNLDIEVDQKEELRWNNRIAALKWQREWSRSAFSNTSLFVSHFDFSTQNLQQFRFLTPDEEVNQSFDYFAFSGIKDIGIKTDWDLFLLKQHSFSIGGEAISHQFTSQLERSNQAFSNEQIDSLRQIPGDSYRELVLFGEWSLRANDYFKMDAGLRYAAYFPKERSFHYFLPRWTASFKPNNKNQIQLGFSRTAQFVHLLETPIVGYPTHIWISGNKHIPAQTANQYFINYSSIISNKWYLRLGAFYKSMHELIAFKDLASSSTAAWEDLVTSGEGRARGFEISLEKSAGVFQWKLGYALSKTTRKFAEINKGRVFPYRYDRRHDIKTQANIIVNDKLQIGLNWTIASGLPFTIGTINFQPQAPPGLAFPPTLFTGQRNNVRMPWLHHLDVSINVSNKKGRFNNSLSVGIYNLYNRFNPFAVRVIPEEQTQTIVLKETSLYPILPFITYKLSF